MSLGLLWTRNMVDDLHRELGFGEGLSGRDWLVDWQTRLAKQRQDQG